MNTKKILLCANILMLVYLVTTLIILIWNYQSMPEKVAMHYDIDGTPNRYGHKGEVFILYGITVFIYALLIFFQKHPELQKMPIPTDKDGMPVNLTRSMWKKHVELNRMMIAGTNLIVIFLMCTMSIYISLGETPNLSLVIVFFVIQILLVIYYYYKVKAVNNDDSVYIKEQIENSRTSFLEKTDGALLEELRVLNGTQYLPENKRLLLISDVRSTHDKIVEYLRTQVPELNEDDINYCLLCCLGLKNNSISACMATSEDALRKRKSRIRKKISDELATYIFDENYGI